MKEFDKVPFGSLKVGDTFSNSFYATNKLFIKQEARYYPSAIHPGVMWGPYNAKALAGLCGMGYFSDYDTVIFITDEELIP